MNERTSLIYLVPKEGRHSRELYVKYLRRLTPYVLTAECVDNRSILEIGCGTTGYATAHLARFASRITAIDTQKDAITFCQTKYQRSNLDFLLADGIKLPFKDNSFDIVISFQVIEHIDPHQVLDYLSEVKRVLKEEGVFWVSTPNPKLRLLPLQKPWNPEHKKEYKHKELQRLLNKVFETVKVYGLCGSKEILSIERNRVKQKPLNVYIVRPYWHLLSRLYHLLSNLSPPAVRCQLERIRDTRRKFLKPKEPIIVPIQQETFLSEFSFDDFTLNPACPKDCLDLIGICTKKSLP